MLLTLLDEYDAPGLVIATTNLKVSLDEALFRRFDDVIEIPMPDKIARERLLNMTLSAIPVDPKLHTNNIAKELEGYSSANIVLIAQRAAKYSVLEGSKKVAEKHFARAISEGSKF
jgi:SpoVK/Ycf46/Vps4 family AAA+-type ATPase